MLSNGIAMEFKELTEEQWSFIKPLLPPQPIVGRKRADDRKTLNGILYVLVTGCRWRDMPRSYGAYQTVWRRHKSWSEEGIWRRILSALQGQKTGTLMSISFTSTQALFLRPLADRCKKWDQHALRYLQKHLGSVSCSLWVSART